LFTSQVCEQALILSHFIIKQDFYAAICENKDKPEMECNGKCHLKKQLKQQEEKESEKEKISIEKESVSFIATSFDLLPQPKTSIAKADIIPSQFLLLEEHFQDIFHPPQFV
jgi:hypothetical protein